MKYLQWDHNYCVYITSIYQVKSTALNYHFYIITLVVLFASSLRAQVNPSNSRSSNGIQVGLNYATTLGYRRLINTKGTENLDKVIHFRDSTESPRFGYFTGLNFLIPLNRSFAFESGLQYSNTRFMRIQTSDPDHAPNRLIKQTSFFNYHYINFPFMVKWTPGESRLRFVTGLGIIAGLYLKDIQCHTYEYDDGRLEEKKGLSGFKYHQFNFSPSVSFGIVYELNEHVDLLLEPEFRYGLSQTVKQPISNYLYSGGLNLSIYLK